MSERDTISKIEEQLGKAKDIDEDPTQKYTSKIQTHLCKLRKEKKLTNKEYFEIYPSDPIPQVYMEQLNLTNQKRTIPCILLYQQLEHHPMKFLSIWLK